MKKQMGTISEQRDDAALLAAAAAGDGDAFAVFYRRHEAAVGAALLRETRDREQAADLLADVFAIALRRASHYRAEHASALPWLYGIARNRAHEARRQRRVQERIRQRLGGSAALVAEDDLDRVAARADHDGAVLALLDRLPDAQRAAVRARVVEERDYAEIAHEQGSSEAAVRQRVSRALAWLRAQLTVATVTAVGLLVAVTAMVVLVGEDATRPGGGPRDTLPALLEALRRPPQAGDAPPAVVELARTWAAKEDAWAPGTIDPGAVRQLGRGAAGIHLHIAPVTPPAGSGPRTTAATGPERGLLILADADGRPVGRPYRLDAGMRGGVSLLAHELPPGDGDVPRTLQAQVVPDGIARIDYRYATTPNLISGATERRTVAVNGNSAAVVLRGRLAGAPLLDVTAYDADGAVVTRDQAQVAGGGPVSPRALCRGVELPPGPTRRPQVSPVDATVRDLCAAAGLPLRAHREADGDLLLRYPGGLLFPADPNGSIRGQIWHSPRGPFPPRDMLVIAPDRPMLR
jgi:RNA polymerase sigma-70 factor (ECF subfamily)